MASSMPSFVDDVLRLGFDGGHLLYKHPGNQNLKVMSGIFKSRLYDGPRVVGGHVREEFFQALDNVSPEVACKHLLRRRISTTCLLWRED